MLPPRKALIATILQQVPDVYAVASENATLRHAKAQTTAGGHPARTGSAYLRESSLLFCASRIWRVLLSHYRQKKAFGPHYRANSANSGNFKPHYRRKTACVEKPAEWVSGSYAAFMHPSRKPTAGWRCSRKEGGIDAGFYVSFGTDGSSSGMATDRMTVVQAVLDSEEPAMAAGRGAR